MGQEASGAIVDAWKGRLVRSGGNLFTGGHYLFSAAGWLRSNPTKLGYIVVPMCINFVLTLGALLTAIRYGGTLWGVIVPSDTGGLLMSIGSWVASVAIFILLLLFVYVLSSVVALPFNERLSEHVEIAELGETSELMTIGRVVGDIWLSLSHSIGAGLIWISVMLFALLLNLIPVIGPFVYIATAWIVTATFLAREVIDSSLSRHRLSFREKGSVVRSHYTVLLGLGGVTAMVLWVPLLNFFMMPLSVVGGTLFYCDLVRDGQVPRDPRTPRTIP
jgi:CysZ protein